jgi:hypothetical protein
MTERWSRTDQISRFAAIVAIVALLASIIPESMNAYHNLFDSPRASITSITDGEPLAQQQDNCQRYFSAYICRLGSMAYRQRT